LRLTFLVLVTTAAGFYMGSGHQVDVAQLLHTLGGTALVAFAAGVLNQYMERVSDGLMNRTKVRPLPSHRLKPIQALVFGSLLAIAGLIYLAAAVNLLTSFLALFTLASYLFIYTPLKRVTSLCTVIGAVPGALPIAMGWTGARGEFSMETWALFSILFLWQLPHFLAIGWLYREDYARGGFPMLPVIDLEGRATARQIIVNCVVLIPVSLFPTMQGLTGLSYCIGASILGLLYLVFGILFAASKTRQRARRLFLSSVIYLPLLLVWMTLDKVVI
jgi:heme o synthase